MKLHACAESIDLWDYESMTTRGFYSKESKTDFNRNLLWFWFEWELLGLETLVRFRLAFQKVVALICRSRTDAVTALSVCRLSQLKPDMVYSLRLASSSCHSQDSENEWQSLDCVNAFVQRVPCGRVWCVVANGSLATTLQTYLPVARLRWVLQLPVLSSSSKLEPSCWAETLKTFA